MKERYIEFKNVTKYYVKNNKKHYILKDYSFKFPVTKNIGILGLNGQGKSTILRMIGGIEESNKGQIILPKGMSISWPLALAGGFHGNLNAYDNIRFICRIYGDDEDTIKEKITYIEEFSELGDAMHQPIKFYSSGMKSRLSFGLSMAFDFDYYLIDETLSVGDGRFRKKSKQALDKKIKNSRVLLVSHDLNTVKEMSDIILLINQGELQIFEDVEQAIEIYKNL